MKYAIRIYNAATGAFHAYLSSKGRTEWKTRQIARAHARQFQKNDPRYFCVLVDDETDEHLSVVNGYSFSKLNGLILYTEAGYIKVDTEVSMDLSKALGLPCKDFTEFLGLAPNRILEALKTLQDGS